MNLPLIFLLVLMLFVCVRCTDNKSNKPPKKFQIDQKLLSNSFSSLEVISNSEGLKEITVPDIELEPLKFSTLIDSVWYLELETNKNSVFERIWKMDYYKGRFYIFDYIGKKRVLIFDKEGKFIKVVGSVGRGPGEYSYTMRFVLNKEEDLLMVFDEKQSKIIHYDLDGKFISEQRIYFRFLDFEYLGENKLSMFLGKTHNKHLLEIDNSQLLIYDLKTRLIEKTGIKYMFGPGTKCIEAGKGSLYNFKDKKLIHTPMSDTIYSYDSERIQPEYYINFGNRRLPRGFDNNKGCREVNLEYLQSGTHSATGTHFLETEDFLIFESMQRGVKTNNYYDKEKGKLLSFSYQSLVIDVPNFSGILRMPFLDLGNNVLVTYNTPYLAKNVSFDKVQKEYKNLIDSMDTYSNPFLVFLKLKSM